MCVGAPPTISNLPFTKTIGYQTAVGTVIYTINMADENTQQTLSCSLDPSVTQFAIDKDTGNKY